MTVSASQQNGVFCNAPQKTPRTAPLRQPMPTKHINIGGTHGECLDKGNG